MSRVAQQALLGGAAPPAAAKSYIGLTTIADTTATPVATGVAIGAEAFDRRVFILVHWINATAVKALASATIGGVAATIHAQSSATLAASTYAGTAIISAVLPTGTTATIALSFATGAAFYHPYLEVYRVTGVLSGVAGDTISATPSGVNPYSGTIDVANQGVLLFGATVYSDATGYTFAGATEDYESSIGTKMRIIGSSLAITANETNRAVSITRTGGAGTGFNGCVVGAAFR